MANYTIGGGGGGGGGVKNRRRGRQARNLTTNAPKILDIKLTSEQIFSKNCLWVSLRLSQSRSLGFLVWCGRTRHDRTIALRAASRATRSKARLVSKSRCP